MAAQLPHLLHTVSVPDLHLRQMENKQRGETWSVICRASMPRAQQLPHLLHAIKY